MFQDELAMHEYVKNHREYRKVGLEGPKEVGGHGDELPIGAHTIWELETRI